MENQTKIVTKKPIISYWKETDPTRKNLDVLRSRLTEVNIIRTKRLTPEFNQFCIENKDRLYLHIVINGMGKTLLEPNIPSVRDMFVLIRSLIDNGFPNNKILIIVDPVLPNINGINAIKFLLRLFTEFSFLRLRRIKFKLLPFYKDKSAKYQLANKNISTRKYSMVNANMFLQHHGYEFFNQYNKLKQQYVDIIEINDESEPIIGVRELLTFGLNNSWKNEDGTISKLIEYENNNVQKPIVNIISGKNNSRCSNRCLLCPLKG